MGKTPRYKKQDPNKYQESNTKFQISSKSKIKPRPRLLFSSGIYARRNKLKIKFSGGFFEFLISFVLIIWSLFGSCFLYLGASQVVHKIKKEQPL
jgi:hypothetical protein